MPTRVRGRYGADSSGTRYGGYGRKQGTKSAGFSASGGYKNYNTVFANKIQSFKTLFGQTTGPGRFTRPTTATLNSFANWINKGAIIQTCTSAQLSRWAKATSKNFNSRKPTPSACKNVLCAKFGKSAIKAVARTKSGSFMVVTSPINKGKKFCFPK